MALYKVIIRASADGTTPDSLMERRIYFVAALDQISAEVEATKRAMADNLFNINILGAKELK